MPNPDHWEKLSDCARAAEDHRDLSAPFGFSTRVAALWAAGARPLVPNMWEWMSVRSVAVALGVMALTLAFNSDLFSRGFSIEVSVIDTIDGPIL
ncbi:MAG: hypothetical protein ISQ14_07255 [Verrucomicrobiae bacterium]|jgi:hypothetical protein|nr:hypothetical protein [Verrucomicrobiae bacterium]